VSLELKWALALALAALTLHWAGVFPAVVWALGIGAFGQLISDKGVKRDDMDC